MKIFKYGILLTIIGLCSACNSEQTIKNADTFLAGKAQTAESRIFADKISAPGEIASLDSLRLLNPFSIVASNDQVIVHNGPPNTKFWVANTKNLSNNFTFGSPGRGPGEYLNPIDIEFSADGSIYVLDSRLRRLDKWSATGEIIESKVFETLDPYRMALAEVSNDLYIFTPPRNQLFHRYDRDYNYDSSFQSSSDSLRIFLRSVLLSGEITSDSNGLYYAGYGNHFLKKYSFDGELLFSRKMIEEMQPPSIITEKTGDGNGAMLRISDDFKPAARTLMSYQDKIFVLYLGNDSNLMGRTVDVYNSDSGDYLYSLQISTKDRRADYIDIDSNGTIYSLEFDKNMNYMIYTYNLNL
jgi:hypothetical protein